MASKRPRSPAPHSTLPADVRAAARLSALALADLDAALGALQRWRANALAEDASARAVVLAALGAQWVVSDFGSMVALDTWASGVGCEPALAVAELEDHAALIYCAGVIALHQVQMGDGLPEPAACVDHFRERLFAAHRRLDRNIVVATAEHVAGWLTGMGHTVALQQLAGLIEPMLDEPQLDARVRVRWLLWMGANQMHTDQRQRAEETWAAAQRTPEAEAWPWLRFQLARMAVRPLIEDGHYTQNYAQAAEQLVAMRSLLDPDRPLDLADHDHLCGWLALATGNPRTGREHYELAIAAARRGALPPAMRQVYEIGLTQALIAEGREEEAIAALATFHVLPGRRGEALRAATVALARACMARRTGAADYLPRLREAMALARSQGLQRFLRLVPPLAAQLAADALEVGIEPEFVVGAIKARRLPPPASAALFDGWPWPIKVYALRPFAVVIDGRPLHFEARAQLKPLLLLQYLAGLEGGPVAVNRVIDALWPQEDPAAARRVFDVNVGRLRQLLLSPTAVAVSQGRIQLNPALVWIDTRALSDVARSGGDAATIGQRALALYRAPLLAHDDEHGFTLVARERASRWFVGAIERAARGALAQGDASTARAWVEQALLVDNSARLHTLARELAVTPSPQPSPPRYGGEGANAPSPAGGRGLG
jgi:LuxR family transcriptional regulator, maltose regulon positive regulatory protein